MTFRSGRPGRWRRPGSTARSEAGTSLPEVLAVVSIFAALSGALVAVLQTVSSFESGRATRAEAQIDVQRAFDAIAADLRVGTPSAEQPAGGRPADTLALLVTDSYATPTLVYWTVGGSGLERLEADPVSLRITGRAVVDPSVEPGPADPFGYFDAAGNRLDPARTTPDQLARCTTLVEITLAVPDGEQLRSASERRAIRTRPPGAEPC
ncbi:MAG: hypothetical protein R2761_28395 [Acidimicrobiales bacterium]